MMKGRSDLAYYVSTRLELGLGIVAMYSINIVKFSVILNKVHNFVYRYYTGQGLLAHKVLVCRVSKK